MSDPRFRPREMAAPSTRRNFGKIADISWLRANTELQASRTAAARLQHLLAVRITKRLRDKELSIRSYADRAGVGYDRMGKVLRGEALMRLEDVTDAERILGDILPPWPDENFIGNPPPGRENGPAKTIDEGQTESST